MCARTDVIPGASAPGERGAMAAVVSDPNRALKRVRRVSRPVTALISIALGLTVIVALFQCSVLLLVPHSLGALAGYVSFTPAGVWVSVGGRPQGPGVVPLGGLCDLRRRA